MSFVAYNALDKIWSGVKRDLIFNPDVSLGYLILSEFEKTPERITQVSADTGVEVTCYEMRQRSIRMSKHLQSTGLKQGDVVGFMATNSQYLAPIVFACFALGLPINSIAPGMPENEIIHMYSKTRPKVVFCDAAFTQSLRQTLNKIAHVKPEMYTLVEKIDDCRFVEDVMSADDGKADDFTFPELVDIANSTALILCTSGTTGLSKGVCLTHSQLINRHYPAWDLKMEKQEVLLNFTNIAWGTAITFLVAGSLYGGKRVITSKDFDPHLAADIFDRYRVTTFITFPYAISTIVQTPNLKPFKHMRAFMTTGNPLSESLSKLAKPFVPNGEVITIYAMTEVGYAAAAFKQQRFGSCGYPTPNVQLKIFDDEGKQLGPNQIGEIQVKTKVFFSGYFEEPEKTAEKLVDGWFKTEDMGYFDDDGFLFIVDRKKTIMWYDCNSVYPSKIEAIIDSVEGVRISCVVGIADESGSDIIFAIVEKDPNVANLNEADILKFVNGQVTDAEQLRGGVHFIDHIPFTPTGKIKRHEVQKFADEIYRSKGPIFDIRTERLY